ncbi:MAG: metal ABC transporter solute-binding protein, Zn/Mn family [Alphaproteobacteria bacterium]
MFLQGPGSAQQPVTVVATFSILSDFVSVIGGDRVEVTAIIGPGGDVHAFQPSPADARAIAEADLVVVNGLEFEGWIDRLIRAAGYDGSLVIASRGVVPLTDDVDTIGNTDETGVPDPHTWQSVENAKIYASNIADALTAIDPAGRALYATNLLEYTAELDALNDEIVAAINALPEDRRTIVTSHDAFGYFADAYSLSFVAPLSVNPGALPGARETADLIRQIKAEGIDALFAEALADPRLLEQIARETGATIGGAIYSDTLSAENGPADTYLRMMRHNLNTLVGALAD